MYKNTDLYQDPIDRFLTNDQKD